MNSSNHTPHRIRTLLAVLYLTLLLGLPSAVFAQKAEETSAAAETEIAAETVYGSETESDTEAEVSGILPEGSVTEEELSSDQIADEPAGVLAKPVLVSASNAMEGVRVTWKTVDGASGYLVMRKNADGWETLKKLTGASTVNYVDTTAVSGTTYLYSVRAWNDEGRSAFDTKGKKILYLSVPEITLSNISSGLKVSWKAVEGASSYRVYYKKADGSLEEIRTTESTSCVDKTVTSGNSYRYVVRAVSGTTISSYRSVEGAYLAAPSGTAKEDNRGVRLTWTEVTGASRYLIYRKQGTGTAKYLGSSCRRSWLDETMPAAGEYTYIVKAANGKAVSGFTSVTFSVTHAHTYTITSQTLAAEKTGGRQLLTCTACGYNRKIALAPEELGLYLYSAWSSVLRTAQRNYELNIPGFTQKSRSALSSIADIRTPQYLKNADGTYSSVYSEPSSSAVLMFTGDLMCQSGQQTAAKETYGEYSFYDSFAYVSGIFDEADFVSGNLETCLSESASYMSEQYTVEGRYHCNAPSTYLDALRAAGFDMVVTANNHALDTGVKGLFQTLSHLDQYGLIHTGTFRKKSEPRYVIVEINGIKVGFLSYTTITNGLASNLTAAGQAALINLYSESKVKADVKAAKEAGAEYIIAWNHWGKEYVNAATETPKKYAQQMADAGVDYIIGSHPHALQEYDVLKAADGRSVPVMYSMGNFVSHQTKKCSMETVILKITLKKNSKGKIILSDEGYIPCRVVKSYKGHNYAILPLTQPYGSGLSVSSAESYYNDIKSIIGDKISVLGTFG